MLSKKTRYAMLALTNLAREYGRGPIPIGRIAEREMIPQRFLEGILLELKNAGILDSTRGKTGGYYLRQKPCDVTLDVVVSIFEGSVGMLACVCVKNYQPCEFCKDETQCKIRSAFIKVHEHTFAVLNSTSLQDLIQ